MYCYGQNYRTVRFLVGAVRLIIIGPGSRKIYFGQQVRTESTIFPIGCLHLLSATAASTDCTRRAMASAKCDVAFVASKYHSAEAKSVISKKQAASKISLFMFGLKIIADRKAKSVPTVRKSITARGVSEIGHSLFVCGRLK